MIALQFIYWYLIDVPKQILRAWKNFLKFNLEYFSIPLLLKTFFSHWRRYEWVYPKGFRMGKYIEIFFSNIISRVLGMLMRIILISTGIIIEILIFFIGGIILIGWFILPILLFIGLGFGFEAYV